MLKKFFTLTALSVLLSTSTYAAITLTNYKFPDGTDCKVSVTGSFDIGIARVVPKATNTFHSEANRTEEDVLPFNLADLGIIADFDNGILQYGVTLGIMPSTNNSRGVNSSVYFKANGFEVNLGNGHGAATKLTIANFTAPIGSPCMAMFYSDDIKKTSYTVRDGLSYLSVREAPGHDRARSITFNYAGDLNANTALKLGISYVPTDGAVGSVSHSALEFRSTPYIENLLMENKNAISLGGRLTYTMDSATIGISLAHELALETVLYRKTKDGMVSSGLNGKDLDVKNYKATSIGASVKFENFEIIGGGSWLYDSFSCKALSDENYKKYADTIKADETAKDKSAEEARVKTIKDFKFEKNAFYGFVGGAINYENFSVGVKYGASKNLLANEFQCWSFMTQYEMTGVKFYANLDICSYERKGYASLTKIEDKTLDELATSFDIKEKKDDKEIKAQVKEKLFEFAAYDQEAKEELKEGETEATTKAQLANQIKYNGEYKNETKVFAIGVKISL